MPKPSVVKTANEADQQLPEGFVLGERRVLLSRPQAALGHESHVVRECGEGKASRRFLQPAQRIVAVYGEHLAKHAVPRAGVHDQPCGVEPAHLPAHRAEDLGKFRVSRQKLRQIARSSVIIAQGDPVRHLEGARLRDVVRHRVHIRHGHARLFGIGADLLDLGDQPVHQLPGQEHQPLHGRAVHGFARRLKPALDPAKQHGAFLGGEFHRLPALFDLFDKRKPSVGRNTRRQGDDHRAPLGNVRKERGEFVVLAAVHVEAAELHEGPAAEKGHGVERVFHVPRVGERPVQPLRVKIPHFPADTDIPQRRDEIRDQIILRAPEHIEVFGTFAFQLPLERRVVERFLFSDFSHSGRLPLSR